MGWLLIFVALVVAFAVGYRLGDLHGHESGHACEREATLRWMERQRRDGDVR
jgi:hypothetical protein